jgi:hypothetical protein
MSDKIYILTDNPYHDNETYYGAYTSEDKAREAAKAFVVDPKNNWEPAVIVAMPLDQPAEREYTYIDL